MSEQRYPLAAFATWRARFKQDNGVEPTLYEAYIAGRATQPQAPQGGVTPQMRELLEDLVTCVGISLEERQRHFDFEKYSAHAGFCRRPRGDQSCQCGYSAMRASLDAHLDECTGYQGTAAIDKARAFLASFPAAPTKTPEELE